MAVNENDLVVGPLTPASGVSTISLDFYFEQAAWIEVYKSGSETPLILGVDYTVTGEGTTSGVVTLTTPANGSDAYSVYLVVPLQRSSDMQLRGEFKSEPFNIEHDRIWQALQGLRTRLRRAVSLSRTDLGAGPIMPERKPGHLLGWGADGNIVNAEAVSVVEGWKDDAEQAADEAEAARDLARRWANAPRFDEVEGGEYSAKHYSEQSAYFTNQAEEAADDAEAIVGGLGSLVQAVEDAAESLTEVQRAINAASPMISIRPIFAAAHLGIEISGDPATYVPLAAPAFGTDADGAYAIRNTDGASYSLVTRALAPAGDGRVYRVRAKVKVVGASFAVRLRARLIGSDYNQIAQGAILSAVISEADGLVTLEATFGRQSGGLVTEAFSTATSWDAATGVRFSVDNATAEVGATFRLYELDITDLTGADAAARSAGDMFATIYDPNGRESDVYARENHTGSQAISTVTGLQSALDQTAINQETITDLVSAEIPPSINWVVVGGRNVAGDGGAGNYASVPNDSYLGPELVVNGDFSRDIHWVKGNGWTINGGKAVKAGTNNNTIQQGFVMKAGGVYETTFTISSYGGTGGFRVQLDGGTTVQGTTRNAVGTYTQRLTALAGNNTLSIVGVGASGEIDNVSMRLVQSAGQVVSGPALLRRRWENREDTITPAMFEDFGEMLEMTRAKMYVPAGDYEVGRSVVTRDGLIFEAEVGATVRPTFNPAGRARMAPIIRFGPGAQISALHLDLVAGINTVRTGVEIGDNSRIDLFRATSTDLNNNRTESGTTDEFSGALMLRGSEIQVGRSYVRNFDRAVSFIDCTGLTIGGLHIEEGVMCVYGSNSRDCHIHSAYISGTLDPTKPNAMGRGVMTPGANGLLLTGVTDSSFSNFAIHDVLEHGVRVGSREASSGWANERLVFSGFQIYRPYGCGFKMDDANAFSIKRIQIKGLYTEDVGNGNWFGEPGYTNWQYAGVDTPSADNDGNKVACAIRNSQYVTVSDVMNRRNARADSGHMGFWLQRSNNVQGSNIDTEYSRTSGVVVQSATGTDMAAVSLRGVASRRNGGHGVDLHPAGNTEVWRGVSVTGIDAQMNTGQGVNVRARPDGSGPYVGSWRSEVEGKAFGNTAGQVNIDPGVGTAAFKDNVSTT